MRRVARALTGLAGAAVLMLVPAAAAQAAASGACPATTVTVTVTGAGSPDTVDAQLTKVVVNGADVTCTGGNPTALIVNGDAAANQVSFTGSQAYSVAVNLLDAGDTFTATGTQGVTVDAGSGDDSVITGAGDDVLNGGAGDDLLRPGGGGGTNDGGSGAEVNGDTISYQDLAGAVTVDLAGDAVSGAVTQTASNIENARGGSGDDTLIGDGADNDLEGLAGDDVLRPKLGGGINDGGSGGETIGDTVAYSDVASSVTVDLGTNIVSGAVTQTVPNVENATGGSGNDTLIGDNLTNRLDGLAGDDLLRPKLGGGINDGGSGGEANGDTVSYADLAVGVTVDLDGDTVSGAVTQTVPNVENATGGSGNDTLIGDAVANRLEGLAGDDLLRPKLGGGVNDGGSGGETNGDTVSYEDLVGAVAVNLETDGVTGAVTQAVPNVENARGGAGGDTLTGDAATNRLEGLAGDDSLRPKAGGGVNDGGSGGETNGDTVTYQDLVAAVTVDLDADTVTGAVTQAVPNVENATGGGGDDVLIGDAGDNRLEGLAGDDVLRPKLGGGVDDGGSGGESSGDTVSYEDLSGGERGDGQPRHRQRVGCGVPDGAERGERAWRCRRRRVDRRRGDESSGGAGGRRSAAAEVGGRGQRRRQRWRNERRHGQLSGPLGGERGDGEPRLRQRDRRGDADGAERRERDRGRR